MLATGYKNEFQVSENVFPNIEFSKQKPVDRFRLQLEIYMI